MKQLTQKGTALSRKEKRAITGGVIGCDLCCRTPGGFQCWYRTDVWNNPTQLCRKIYPAWATSVTGAWYC